MKKDETEENLKLMLTLHVSAIGPQFQLVLCVGMHSLVLVDDRDGKGALASFCEQSSSSPQKDSY